MTTPEAGKPIRSDTVATNPQESQIGQKYAQLLGHQENILARLQKIRSELDSPLMEEILRDLREATGSSVPQAVRRVTEGVEEVIRSIQLSQSEVHKELLNRPGRMTVEGITNLPAFLGRFLAERAEAPDFHYRVEQDEIRGWIIHWREMGPGGVVRGAGRFYERPYAWLES